MRRWKCCKAPPPDPRDDIYALACVAYELFCGSHPFNRERIDACIDKRLRPKKTQTLDPSQSRALNQALSFQRAQRTATVEAFLAGLEATARPVPRHIVWPIVLLVAVGFAAWYFRDRIAVDAPEQDSTQADRTLSQTVDAPPETAVSTPSESVVETEPDKKSEKAPLPALPAEVLTVSLNQTAFKIGESLVIDFRVKEPLYVYLAVIDAADRVAWVFPNPYQENNYCVPGKRYRIPPENGEFTLDIGEPKGTDRLVAIASAQPLSIERIDVYHPEKLQETQRAVVKTLAFTIE